ncbi:hypothetical protein [Intestinimonas massiliensis (ex Afouda et al. 2020)]|uniref:hypothetical protein n=1 Tax=Intestinimonas massiliensis (ex Afouda et al. 2020) TaxID=1673721 RepID=UPI0010322D98|nr:hypothetical protein [Intestinimonas massiliensis (ex Afouda et al. 2020)]
MDWLIRGAILLAVWIIVAIAVKIDRKNGHYTPKEKRFRKQWEAEREAEEKANQEFRAASKPLTQQSFEEWKAANKKQP